MREIEIERKTKETDISLRLGLPELLSDGTIGVPEGAERAVEIHTGIPFFDHMLEAMLFHGGFSVQLRAVGDTEVDDHHTVEDVGIVLGTALRKSVEKHGPVQRFARESIPMDDALAEVIVDAGGRSFLAYRAEYPQDQAGTFDLALVREFFQGLTNQAHANVHVIGHYALNGHHLAEAIFKAGGRALSRAYLPRLQGIASTKGVL